MSGICGVFRLDRSPASGAELEATLARLERRGPDGTQAMCEGPVALGHALLATTPEARFETLPLRHAMSGCSITADVRLDNREELIERLGRTDQRGDGELVLRAYLTWGPDCLDHLIGDFAFAIWDPREQRLFCARDQTGMRQLIYHYKPAKLFAFATDPIALLEHGEIPLMINEERLADCLEELEAHDLESTPFLGVHRLQAGHAMLVDQAGPRTWSYWQLQPQDRLELKSDDDYAEALLEVLAKAVTARLRSPDPVGSMLSGGLDSGSIVAIASRSLKEQGRAPLQTFSAIDDRPGCIETGMIRRSQNLPHIASHSITPAGLMDRREEIERLLLEMDDPFDGWMNLQRAVYLAARDAGTKVVLDGVPGDLIIGLPDPVSLFADNGRWASALREAWGQKRFWGFDHPSAVRLARLVWRKSLPDGLLGMRDAQIERRRLLQEKKASPLAANFAERVRMTERRDAFMATIRPDDRSEMGRRRLAVLHPFSIVARERYDRTAAALGIETRAPFMDTRLMEFSLSLPPDQLQRHGWHKLILRRALRGYLPNEVLWRKGNESVNWQFTAILLKGLKPQLDIIVRSRLEHLVSERYLETFLATGFEAGSVAKHDRMVYVAAWLDNVTKSRTAGDHWNEREAN